MKRIKDNTRDQGVLFSEHYVGDRLSEDDEVFLFEKLFDRLDISVIINSYSTEGGSMFSPRDQLAIILFAFHKGITSSVKIAELIRYNLQFIYLAGGHIIKRRTICDFRLKHIESIKEIFTSSVDLAIDSGLINLNKIFALDGSKIEANASFSMTRKKGEWEERQKKIVEHVEKFLHDWEEQDKLEENLEEEKKERFDRISEKLNKIKKQNTEKRTIPKKDSKKKVKKKGDKDSSSKKKESSAVRKKNKIKVKEGNSAEKYLDEYENINDLIDEYKESNDDMLLSLTDSDCRIMRSDSISKECYNAQIISNNQVIVAMDITQDENDQAQLEPMIEQLKENIGIKEEIKFTADAGYNKGKNLAYIDNEALIDAYISMYSRSEIDNPEESKFKKDKFIFNENSVSWECPAGEKLNLIKEFIKDKKKHTLYGCELKECIFCSNRELCLSTKADIKRGYRTIEDDGFLIFRKEMKDKLQNKESKKIYSQRAGEVEPVFGQIKNNRDFIRFKLKGLGKVKGEFTIMAIAHNLGKIMSMLKREMQLI